MPVVTPDLQEPGVASGDRRRPALRAGLIAIAGLTLAWLSAAGYLPSQIANTPVYVSLAASVGNGT